VDERPYAVVLAASERGVRLFDLGSTGQHLLHSASSRFQTLHAFPGRERVVGGRGRVVRVGGGLLGFGGGVTKMQRVSA
jgi:hypothetical protein